MSTVNVDYKRNGSADIHNFATKRRLVPSGTLPVDKLPLACAKYDIDQDQLNDGLCQSIEFSGCEVDTVNTVFGHFESLPTFSQTSSASPVNGKGATTSSICTKDDMTGQSELCFGMVGI